VKFVVATDFLEVQQELENIFPGRIIIHNKSRASVIVSATYGHLQDSSFEPIA
jgi:hypothetical protein